MKNYITHTIHHERLRYNYLRFDNVTSFNQFVDDEPLNYSNKNIWQHQVLDTSLSIEEGTDWYGHPIPESLDDLENHTHYLGMHLIKKLQPKIQAHLNKYLEYLNSNVMPEPKVDYNDRGLGMFSFDRAALGLVKLHRVNLSTPIHTINSQLDIELDRKTTTTQVKKVFAFFKDKQIALPSMRLYIMAGANAHITGDEMLYVGLASGELVTFMEQRGVPVEVNVMIGNEFSNNINLGIVTVKRFQDQLDKNQLLLMSSDPRYFRFRGFKALVSLSNRFGLDIPSSFGRLDKDMGKHFAQLLNTQQPEMNGFVFEQSYSLDAAAKEVTRIIETYNQQKDAKKA